ncbi:apolipophorins-like [Tautogolabrus adspersus]
MHTLVQQIRNPQIKRLSPQKEHSVQRLKSLRDSLERTRLKFSLHGGKVMALCLQEGEQVWALNIKKALLSMLQTSRTASKQELQKETDVYGTCNTRYERRGPLLLKNRDLKQCHQSRLANFWPHSVPVTEDTSLQSELHCVQRHGSTVMEEVNCTETVSMATWSRTAGLVKTQTVSVLLLLRAQPGTPSDADSLGPGVLTDLQFEDEGAAGPGRTRSATLQQASQTVRMLCSLSSDPQQRSVLLQLYRSSQEDPEVRIAAYQQLLRCPDQDVFEVVKKMLRNETSSQVGSYVWSHLTNVLRSEDPMKQPLIESLPDDIISRDFEAEFMKYSSYSDHTVSSGMGITNIETSLVFSPKSFLPRSATANLTVYFHGRAHNLLEMDLHVENAEPLLKNMFGHDPSGGESAAQSHSQSKEAKRTRRKTDDGHRGEKETCLSSTSNYLAQAKAMLFGRGRTEENRLKCWLGVKVFGNELSVFTCDDLYNQMNQLSLSAAGLAVKLLKGQEVQVNHRAVLMTEELILPSLSGLPIKLGINMTSLLSLRLKGNINHRDMSHFSLAGYIKPNAHVGLSVRMGVDGALGQAAVDWVSDLTSSTSLEGSIQLQEGRDLRVTLNTPDDIMDIISVSSRVFQLSGDHREEIKGPKSRVQKTTCTPKTWSKMVGWQLCSNTSYPLPATGVFLPPPGPVHLSLRLLKLDRGLHYYLLEAAYSMLLQVQENKDFFLIISHREIYMV